jgi:hypothetical protein
MYSPVSSLSRNHELHDAFSTLCHYSALRINSTCSRADVRPTSYTEPERPEQIIQQCRLRLRIAAESGRVELPVQRLPERHANPHCRELSRRPDLRSHTLRLGDAHGRVMPGIALIRRRGHVQSHQIDDWRLPAERVVQLHHSGVGAGRQCSPLVDVGERRGEPRVLHELRVGCD